MTLDSRLQNFADNSLGRYASCLSLSLARALTRQLRLAGVDLTTDQCRVLFVLFFHDGCTQQELGHMLQQDKSGVSRQLNSLEHKGLLLRVSSAQGERFKRVRLTEQGWALQDACLKCGEAVQEPLLNHFTDEERTQFFALLRKALQFLPH